MNTCHKCGVQFVPYKYKKDQKFCGSIEKKEGCAYLNKLEIVRAKARKQWEEIKAGTPTPVRKPPAFFPDYATGKVYRIERGKRVYS